MKLFIDYPHLVVNKIVTVCFDVLSEDSLAITMTMVMSPDSSYGCRVQVQMSAVGSTTPCVQPPPPPPAPMAPPSHLEPSGYPGGDRAQGSYLTGDNTVSSGGQREPELYIGKQIIIIQIKHIRFHYHWKQLNTIFFLLADRYTRAI